MMELEVILDFACSCCGHNMGVTLKCAGKNLNQQQGSVTSVKVPCPTCQSINKVFFEPCGVLHYVAPAHDSLRIPEPSLN